MAGGLDMENADGRRYNASGDDGTGLGDIVPVVVMARRTRSSCGAGSDATDVGVDIDNVVDDRGSYSLHSLARQGLAGDGDGL